jgi:hypothetical protein
MKISWKENQIRVIRSLIYGIETQKCMEYSGMVINTHSNP